MAAPLEFDQLQTFCTIADCSSLTKAAPRVNKTQSAVSMQIKRLEERLGDELFVRHGSSVVLTELGEALNAKARRTIPSTSSVPTVSNRQFTKNERVSDS